MIDIIKTIFLGIIQGITEWLPISLNRTFDFVLEHLAFRAG